MAPTNSGNYDALAWVQDEVQQSLVSALQALTNFIDAPEDSAVLNQCVTQLHQITGTMEMLNLKGAHLLVREMLTSALAIRDQRDTDHAQTQDSLLKGLLLLPNYLTLLGPNLSDHPLRLIETINELRIARGEVSIEVNDVFTPNLSVDLPSDISYDTARDLPNIGLSFHKISHAFQISLLHWIKNDDRPSLRKMGSLVNYLRLNSTNNKVIAFWWIAEGVIEAILDNGLATDPKTKLIMGKLNQPIKLFTKQGEQQLLALFPDELTQQLLLLLAQTTSNGEHVSTLKNTFQLDFFDPQQHHKIYNFGDNALADVHGQLLEQLLEIKEQISQFEQDSDDSIIATIDTISTHFSTMSDTLILLAESTASALLQHQSKQLKELTLLQQRPNDDQLLSLANDLLQVENLLQKSTDPAEQTTDNDQLLRTVVSECLNELNNIKETLALLENRPDSASETLSDAATQLELMAGSISMLNMHKAADLLTNTALQMTHTSAKGQKLSPNELESFAEVIAAAELYMEGFSQHGQQQTLLLDKAQHILSSFGSFDIDNDIDTSSDNESQSESIADEIDIIDLPLPSETSVDRYIQTQAERPSTAEETILESIDLNTSDTPTSVDPYIQTQAEILSTTEETILESIDLDNHDTLTGVERYIQSQTEIPSPIEDVALESTELDISNMLTGVERYIQSQAEIPSPIENVALESTELDISNMLTGVERYIQAQTQATPSDAELPLEDQAPQFAEGIDAEIAEIFIEEANEVLIELESLIPAWKGQHDPETLTIIRRHFHTLKGSGRMAGANIIGELSWSLESLLNDVIDNGRSISPALEQLIIDGHQIIPGLLSLFTSGNMHSTVQVDELASRTYSLLSTEEADVSLSEQDELQQIFNNEAKQHIASFKHALSQAEPPFSLNNDLLRAAHSLKGCASIAQVAPIAIIADQLDASLRKIHGQALSLDQQQLSLLTDTIEGISQIVEHIDHTDTEEPDIRLLSDNLYHITPHDAQQQLIDPELLIVYLEETDELLEQYTQQVRQLQQQPENLDYQVDIQSTLASLTSSAQHANLTIIADLYQLLGQLIQHSSAPNSDVFTLLEKGYEELNNQIEHLIQNQPATEINTFKQHVENYLTPQTDEADVVTDNPEIESALFAIPTGDLELLEAFTEECAELLESSGNAIKLWQQDNANQDASMQLQRDLHTIKGGARLTGISPIADLTHHTESLVSSTIDNPDKLDNKFFNLLLRCQDHLAEMQDQLASNTEMSFSHDLLVDISQFSGQPVPEDTPAPAAETEVTQQEHAVKVIAKLAPKPIIPTAEKTPQPTQVEQVRVRSDLLDFLTNFAGEVNISRDRVSQQNVAMRQQLTEMESTVERLQEQLRNLEIETEAQILFRYEDETLKQQSEFDPLELDRFSMMQQLSRGLTESVSDLNDITQSLDILVRESDTILLQQSRLSTDLQQGLMNTRLLPFTGLIPRFERIVRQTNDELGKKSELTISGAEHELDRTILDHLVAPIEHILRNAIAHGVESKEIRKKSGKQETATLILTITRDGSEILITLSDDGQGIDVEKIKQKALELELIDSSNIPSNEELIQLILSSGFSTADSVSQLAGRGVGMDIVSNEIRALKGRLSIKSVAGQGTTFTIRLPMTLSIMQALLVSSNEQQYAIPMAAIYGGERITVTDIKALLQQDHSNYEFNGEQYQFIALANLLDKPLKLPDDSILQLPLLLFQYGDAKIALLVDSINSNREIVLKSVGEQLGQITAINGATILGDGQVVFILDIPTLVDTARFTSSTEGSESSDLALNLEDTSERTPIAMVVDDSITMRKASSNMLKRHGFDVTTARDGVDAVSQLNEQIPDIILLDVEMPRMDGFEFATLVRNDPELKQLPIIMITSRTGDKHRERAMNIGVNAYMGKPYQETEIVKILQKLLGDNYPDTED
ncbi:MAG: Hpt domain-containing protein [Methylophagaceae bacterium]